MVSRLSFLAREQATLNTEENDNYPTAKTRERESRAVQENEFQLSPQNSTENFLQF